MTKHIVSNREVYHLWANQAQDWARSNNRSFNGNSANSYGAEIGRIVTNAQGQRAYLVSGRSYSVTTAAAQSGLWASIPESATRFRLADTISYDRAAELAGIVEDAAKQLVAAGRARANKPWELECAEARFAEAIHFAEFFGLPVPAIPDLADLKAAAASTAAIRAEAERVKAEQRRTEQEDNLRRWLAGEYVEVYGLRESFLRIMPSDPEQVETTNGARVPLSHVRRALPGVLRLLNLGKETKIESAHIGHFQLGRVEDDGTVVVGCHRFTAEEVKRFATTLTPAE